jgi:hypothetical protein
MTTRREFLHLAAAGLLIAGAPITAACGGVRRDDLSRPTQWMEPVKGLGKDEMEILYLASLAPSGHNLQPWTVRVAEPGHWVIGYNRSFQLPAVDPDNRELLLAIGAFMENMVIAARASGLEVQIEVPPGRPTAEEIAHVRFHKTKPDGFPLDGIKRRRTIRNGLSTEEIRADDLRYATRHDEESCVLATVPSPHAFYYPNSSKMGKTLQERVIEANRTQAFRDPAQEELSRWIRWSDKDAKLNRNGLTPESMEINGLARWYVRNFYDASSVLRKDFRQRTVDMVARQVKSCGGWLVVTSLDSEVPTLIAYGMAFERLCLKVRDRMIGLHPMTQMIEEQGPSNVAASLGLPGQVQWILRMGYVRSYPAPVSLRRPVSWFVTG